MLAGAVRAPPSRHAPRLNGVSPLPPSLPLSLLICFVFLVFSLLDIPHIGWFSCHLPLSAARRVQVKIQLIAKDAMARVSFMRSFSPVGQPSLVPSTGGCQLQAG